MSSVPLALSCKPDNLALEDGNDTLFRNVDNKQGAMFVLIRMFIDRTWLGTPTKETGPTTTKE
jgi:hypothetical protein